MPLNALVTRGKRNPLYSGLGERLKSERKAQGLTFRGLAERAGVAKDTPQKVERGSQFASVVTIELLANGLGVSPGWLAYGLGPKEAPSLHHRRKAAALADHLDTLDEQAQKAADLLRIAYSLAADDKPLR